MLEPEDDLELAVDAARAAGAVAMKWFRTDLEVTHKAPDQPVTRADLEADTLLRERLLEQRPTYGWLSEETADTADRLEREYVWLVDPIDGTRSFIAGRREFTISIGLSRAGRPVLAAVLNPATGELFTALAGRGAYAGERKLRVGSGGGPLVMVASRSEIARGYFSEYEIGGGGSGGGGGYEVRGLGSTAYKLCKVAQGEVAVFMSRGPKGEWDLCGGDLIVREAGGLVTDLSGERLQYNRPVPHITGVVAARAELHAELIGR
ncbi:MAG: 3'(2'),5'-bisphosphate nucleotidase CysQ [Gemmatimonadota bacterium]